MPSCLPGPSLGWDASGSWCWPQGVRHFEHGSGPVGLAFTGAHVEQLARVAGGARQPDSQLWAVGVLACGAEEILAMLGRRIDVGVIKLLALQNCWEATWRR